MKKIINRALISFFVFLIATISLTPIKATQNWYYSDGNGEIELVLGGMTITGHVAWYKDPILYPMLSELRQKLADDNKIPDVPVFFNNRMFNSEYETSFIEWELNEDCRAQEIFGHENYGDSREFDKCIYITIYGKTNLDVLTYALLETPNFLYSELNPVIDEKLFSYREELLVPVMENNKIVNINLDSYFDKYIGTEYKEIIDKHEKEVNQ